MRRQEVERRVTAALPLSYRPCSRPGFEPGTNSSWSPSGIRRPSVFRFRARRGDKVRRDQLLYPTELPARKPGRDRTGDRCSYAVSARIAWRRSTPSTACNWSTSSRPSAVRRHCLRLDASYSARRVSRKPAPTTPTASASTWHASDWTGRACGRRGRLGMCSS